MSQDSMTEFHGDPAAIVCGGEYHHARADL
jgi:hypothetical protein